MCPIVAGGRLQGPDNRPGEGVKEGAIDAHLRERDVQDLRSGKR